MNIYPVIFNALIPIFLLIVTGYLARRGGFPGDHFWPAAEKLTYFLLFPSLLFFSTATASFSDLNVISLLIGVGAAISVMVIITLLTKPMLSVKASSFTSIFQGSIRFNTYVGFAIALALFGNKGLTWASVIIAFLIPLVNLLSVIVLLLSAEKTQKAWFTHSLAVIKTPPLLACLAGIGFNISGISLPVWVGGTLQLFGRASLPLGLLAVGAAISITSARGSGWVVTFVTLLKLLVLPILMWLICSMLGVEREPMIIAILFAALPGSASSYILAKQLGGDSLLMANIVSVQIVVSLITLPPILAFLMTQ